MESAPEGGAGLVSWDVFLVGELGPVLWLMELELHSLKGSAGSCSRFWEYLWGFPGGSDSEASACTVGDQGSILGSGRSLEKEMATHSNILAWKIPWIEEPGELQSAESQRVRHD